MILVRLFIILAFALFIPTAVFTQEISMDGYTSIDWISAPGVQTYIKAPKNIGFIDYLTIIDLTRHEIRVFATTSPRTSGGGAVSPFSEDMGASNWHFPRTLSETLKSHTADVSFMWNAPFFNVTMTSTPLSLALKSTDGTGAYISSGNRPDTDMLEARKMLLINNEQQTARIADFDADIFVQEGDQGVEGFDPLGSPSNRAVQASRVYLGVRNEGTELIVYCSRSASKTEASDALIAAGVPITSQIQVDGGGSAMCGYNQPGQYFVESGRPLPVAMGAFLRKKTGTVTISNLNVRSGPDTTHSISRTLALNEEVTIYEEQNGWIRISDTEWVYSAYIKQIQVVPYNKTVATKLLNVRSGNGLTHAITRTLALDTAVTIYEVNNGWARISPTEWVSEQLLK